MARSARYKKALQALDAAVSALNAFQEENAEVLRIYAELVRARTDAENELKEAAKEEAAKDPTFRGDQWGEVRFTIIENKMVDVEKLKKLVPPDLFKKLLSPQKEVVTVEKFRSALEMGLIDKDKASGVLVSKGFSLKFYMPEEGSL